MARRERKTNRLKRQAGEGEGKEEREAPPKRKRDDGAMIVYIVGGIGALVVIGLLVMHSSSAPPDDKKAGAKTGKSEEKKTTAAADPVTPPVTPPVEKKTSGDETKTPAAPAVTPEKTTPRPPPPPAGSAVVAVTDSEGKVWEFDYSALKDYITLQVDPANKNPKPEGGRLNVTFVWQNKCDFHPVEASVDGASGNKLDFNRALEDRKFGVILTNPKGARIRVVTDPNKEAASGL